MGKPKPGPAREAYKSVYGNQFSWGSISAWAWGARRVLDHVIRLPEVDGNHIAISGHSRNGKTALLAGALDERFAVVNPAGSGCAGAGSYLALGENCEDLAALTSRDRWWAWAHADFESWAGREEELPFDQHFLMSLVAPRPLLRTEGIDDHWANPEGTSVSVLATQPIYDFLNVADRNTISYRDGGHTHSEEDAKALMMVCDECFFGCSREAGLSQTLALTPSTDTLFDWNSPPRP
jgi:endo-1,4-beta-xylanase